MSYGRRMELPTNDPVMQEIILLCIMIQQNSLVMVNTLLVDRTIEEKRLRERMTAADKRALTPLFTQNVNPYGGFELDLTKPPILERRRDADAMLAAGEEKVTGSDVPSGDGLPVTPSSPADELHLKAETDDEWEN